MAIVVDINVVFKDVIDRETQVLDPVMQQMLSRLNDEIPSGAAASIMIQLCMEHVVATFAWVYKGTTGNEMPDDHPLVDELNTLAMKHLGILCAARNGELN